MKNAKGTGFGKLKNGSFRSILAASLVLACFSNSQGATLALGNWVSTDGETVTGADADDPSFSPVSGGGAGGGIYASFNSPLAWSSLSVGDNITLSGTYTVTGTASTTQAFRFGLWDSNGSSNNIGWSGYVVVSQNSSSSMVFERSGTSSDFSTTSGGTGSFIGSGVYGGTQIGNGQYSFQQVITKTATGLSMSISIVGINGTTYSMTSSLSDTSVTIDQLDRVGFVFASAYSADSVQFNDILVTTSVPEPSTWALLSVAGAAGILMYRRKCARRPEAWE